MDFLFSFIISLFSTISFSFVWKRMPQCWLFDCSSTECFQCFRPHPKADRLSQPIPRFLLFVLFFAHSLRFSEKIALMDVLGASFLLWFLTQIALADLYYRLIPDQWSVGIALLGMVRLLSQTLAIDGFSPLWTSHIPGLVLCLAVFLFLSLLPQLLTGTPALGFGDVKLLFALAVVFPTRQFLFLLECAAFAGGIAAIVLLLFKQGKRGVPYGTMLLVGYLFLILKSFPS